jgi:CheY-like chemotaxis protein
MTAWLIIEDDKATQQLFITLTQVLGHESIGFLDGQAALDWIKETDEGNVPAPLPTVALLDIRLPMVSGVDIARRLRQSPVLRRMRIVLMTASNFWETEKQAMMTKTGADLILRKPLPNLMKIEQMLRQPTLES